MIADLDGPTIEAGDSLSDAIDCRSGEIVRIVMPADWTFALLTFQISSDGNSYNDLFTGKGAEVTIHDVKAGSAIVLNPAWYGHGGGFLKFRSGTRDHPVVQKARREFATTCRRRLNLSSLERAADDRAIQFTTISNHFGDRSSQSPSRTGVSHIARSVLSGS